MDEYLLNEKGLKVGEQVELTCFYYRYGNYHEIFLEPLVSDTFIIAGTTNIAEYTGDGVRPDLLLPFETMRNIFHEKGIEFTADSCSFQVKNPYELNAFKKEMHELGFLPVSFQSDFQYDGNALTVKDDTYIRSAEQLVKNRNLLQWILPLLAVGVLGIGFVMAELLMKGRIAEYAIMRSLGQSHQNVNYSYKTKYQTVHAVRDVSCSFQAAHMYAIVGESGSGKTTLLSLLAGLDVADEGEILVDDMDLKTINRDDYRKNQASVVYQAFHLFPLLTALEHVMYPMEMKKADKAVAAEKAKALLHRAGLTDKIFKQFPLMMSGGEQQRVAIARALAAGGSILLADEPTGNLDTENEKILLHC